MRKQEFREQYRIEILDDLHINTEQKKERVEAWFEIILNKIQRGLEKERDKRNKTSIKEK